MALTERAGRAWYTAGIKASVALILLSAALAGAAVYVYRSGIEGAVLDRRAKADVPNLARRFVRAHRPELVLSLAQLPQWQTDPVLVDTAASFAESRQFCEEDSVAAQAAADKGRTWHDNSICGGTDELGAEFFAAPPFLHLSGRSYAALASTKDPARFGTAAWLQAHTRFMHVSELRSVAARGVKLSAAEELVSRLTNDEVHALVTGTPLAIAAHRLFVPRGPAGGDGPPAYGVYPVAQFQRFLEATPLSASPRRAAESCAAAVGEVCFEPNAERVSRRIDQASALGGASALGLVLVAFVGVVRRARARRREQDARLFVLQTLSHEIRTPTTSLALSLEPIRARFDDLPEEVQPAFLRLCDGVQRLQRVVEASTRYLRGQIGDGPVHFDEVTIPSANDFVLGVLGAYDRDLPVTLLPATVAARLDPYWVGVCIKNLIDNALEHGAEPVSVHLGREGDDLVVTVQDGGLGPAGALADVARPFSRGSSSQGLGLGLAVVQRLVRAMGGELRLELRPTRFSIVLPACAEDGAPARRLVTA